MFGLWYSLIGLIFGFICSYFAAQKDRARKDWFTLGFIFSFIALSALLLLPSTNKEKDELKTLDFFDEDYQMSINH
jgi:hypothetical protein